MTGSELARRDQDAFALGKVFKESGMFPTVKKEAEAVVKILAGREFGLGPLASMQGIHMVDGKPTLAANLIAGQIKRHPNYDYRVVRREDNGCELEFFQRGIDTGQGAPFVSLGVMKWEKKDATAAGLLGKMNWKKYPRDMYFARCLTAGARTYCPDVLGGSPIYTAEELGHDAEGAAVEVEVTPRRSRKDEPSAPDPADAVVAEAVETLNAVECVSAKEIDALREAYNATDWQKPNAKDPHEKLKWELLSLVSVDQADDIPRAMAGLSLEDGATLMERLLAAKADAA